MAADENTKKRTFEENMAFAKDRGKSQPLNGVESTNLKPSIRKPPEGDAQADFFVPLLYEVATKLRHKPVQVLRRTPGGQFWVEFNR